MLCVRFVGWKFSYLEYVQDEGIIIVEYLFSYVIYIYIYIYYKTPLWWNWKLEVKHWIYGFWNIEINYSEIWRILLVLYNAPKPNLFEIIPQRDHKEGEQLEDRRSVGASSCNFGDGTDQRVQSLMFMMTMMYNPWKCILVILLWFGSQQNH